MLAAHARGNGPDDDRVDADAVSHEVVRHLAGERDDAALSAAYVARRGTVATACTEAIFTIEPPPTARRKRMAALETRNTLVRFVAMTSSHPSSDVSSRDIASSMAALFATMSKRPNRAFAVDDPLTVLAPCDIPHLEANIEAAPTQLALKRSPALAIAGHCEDGRTVGRKALDHGRADAGAPASHQGDLAAERGGVARRYRYVSHGRLRNPLAALRRTSLTRPGWRGAPALRRRLCQRECEPYTESYTTPIHRDSARA